MPVSSFFKVPMRGRITKVYQNPSQYDKEKVRRWIEDSVDYAESIGCNGSQSSTHSNIIHKNEDIVVPTIAPVSNHQTFCPIVLHSSSTDSNASPAFQNAIANQSFQSLSGSHIAYSHDNSFGSNDNCHPMRYNLNASFESHATQSCAERINKSFSNIQGCLNMLSEFYGNGVADTNYDNDDMEIVDLPHCNNNIYETQQQDMVTLPNRTFNENSINMSLAFTDMDQFSDLIHKENEMFVSETNAADYIDSQLVASQTDLSVLVVSKLTFSIYDELPTHVRMLQKGLNKIFADKSYMSTAKYHRASLDITNDRAQVRIRELFARLDADIRNKKKVTLQVQNTNDWKNMVYQDGILKVKDKDTSKYSQLRSRTNLVLYLLRKIYGLLVLNTQLTKRSIYYQLKSLLPKQRFTQEKVTAGINIVSCMLDTPMWHLNVLSTSKGLVYGDLTFTIGQTETHCKAQNGTSIPMDLNDLKRVESKAYFILIVEKDTVFQKLLADDLPNKLSRNFILITGKGYADVSTRRFIHIIWKLLAIPLFIVVDADAYGIDIFLSYKFGSKTTSFLSHELALPTLKWLGVFPSELKDYQIQTLKLSTNDGKRLKGMLTRPYFANGQNREIKNEIEVLMKNKQKCEIEGLFQTNHFFAKKYLPHKFYQSNFI